MENELIEQVDLFESLGIKVPGEARGILNGMYYERSSGKFVSFVCGRRHYEVVAQGCGLDHEWQDRTKRFRSIE